MAGVGTSVTPCQETPVGLPRRSDAAIALPVAFAATAATFGSEFLYDVALRPTVAVAIVASTASAAALLLTLLRPRVAVGSRLARTAVGSLLARPPTVAVGLVALSLCGLVAWILVGPESTTGAQAAGASLAATVLYLPAVLLYAGTFVLAVLPVEASPTTTAVVRTVVFVGGAALSAVWQLLLASAVVRGASRLSDDSEERPARAGE